MERNQKRKLVVSGCAAVILIALIVLSLLAPHGEDFQRGNASAVLEGKLEAESTGIYLPSPDGDEPVLLGKGEAAAEWTFAVEESGDYYLSAGYMALEGNGQELEFQILLDGSRVADSAITLTRIWADSGEFRRTASEDEIRPTQSEVSLWTEEPFRQAKKERVCLHLEKGEHAMTVQGTSQSGLFRYLRLYREELPSYEEYLSMHSGAEKAEEGFYIQVEGESPYMKSSSQLYAVYDRSSPFTVPYHATCLRYNTIGGSNWSDSGQWIEWQVEVPKDGFYQLGLRYRQDENKGQSSLRRLEIDGQVPFSEVGGAGL